MTQSARSVAEEVDHNFVERCGNDASECEAVLATPRRCVDALWSYLDGVFEAQVTPEVAG